jgi:hypothetical protein
VLNTKEGAELVSTQTFSTFFCSINLTNLLIFLGKKLPNFLYQKIENKNPSRC